MYIYFGLEEWVKEELGGEIYSLSYSLTSVSWATAQEGWHSRLQPLPRQCLYFLRGSWGGRQKQRLRVKWRRKTPVLFVILLCTGKSLYIFVVCVCVCVCVICVAVCGMVWCSLDNTGSVLVIWSAYDRETVIGAGRHLQVHFNWYYQYTASSNYINYTTAALNLLFALRIICWITYMSSCYV